MKLLDNADNVTVRWIEMTQNTDPDVLSDMSHCDLQALTTPKTFCKTWNVNYQDVSANKHDGKIYWGCVAMLTLQKHKRAIAPRCFCNYDSY